MTTAPWKAGDPGDYTRRWSWVVNGVTEYERLIDWQERAVRIVLGEQDIDR